MGWERVRAVLFDLDGVLVQSYEAWFPLINAAARAFGAPPISRQTFAECWGQGVEEDVRRFYPDRTIAEVEAYFHAHFMDHAEHLRVEPLACDVVRALDEAAYALAVVTNTPGRLARDILERAHLPLSTVVGGTDVPHPKPAPDMVLEACRRLGVPPAGAVVVGDSDFDARAAAAAGVRFIGFRRPGDASVADLGELRDAIERV